MTTRARLAWGGHDPSIDVAEVADVDWDGTRRVRVRLAEAMTSHKPLVVHGPKGAGKTFAVAWACEAYLDNHPNCQVTYLRIPTSDRGRGLYQSIMNQIGRPVKGSGWTETLLMFELASIVCETERIVVVDEAHRMSRHAMYAVQNLVDVAGKKATFVLVGSEETPKRLIAELWSRAEARIRFRPLGDDECAAWLGALHPVFAATDAALLQRMNRLYARGEIRYWMAVLARVFRYSDMIGVRIEPDHVEFLTDDL